MTLFLKFYPLRLLKMKKWKLSSIANYTFKLIILLLIFWWIYLCFYFWSNQKNFLNDLACKNIENYQNFAMCSYRKCYNYDIFYSPITNSCIVTYTADGEYNWYIDYNSWYNTDTYYVYQEINWDTFRSVRFNISPEYSWETGCIVLRNFPMYKNFDKNECNNLVSIMMSSMFESEYLNNKTFSKQSKNNKIQLFYK